MQDLRWGLVIAFVQAFRSKARDSGNSVSKLGQAGWGETGATDTGMDWDPFNPDENLL